MPIYPYSFQLPPLNVQDIPSNGAVGEFLGISAGGVLDWLPVATGGGDMLKSENLSGLADYAIARTNIGLGTASTPTFANLTLTSPSLASSAPVTISQTWNAVGQTFKALVVNAAGTSGTNSASGSLLADFQVGGVTQASISKSGNLTVTGNLVADAGNSSLSGTALRIGNSNGIITLSGGSLVIPAATAFGWANTLLVRDGADNTLALRNGAAAQTFNVYGTYTSASVYERMFMRYNGTALAFQVGAETLGATARPLEFLTAGTRKLVLTATGNNIATFYSASNSTTNILTLRNLSDVPKFQFYLNPSGNAEAYIGANTLLSETGSSYFNGVNVGIGTTSPTSKLHVAETWNNAGTTFCAIKSVITDTNSAAGSDFLELYSGTSTQPLRMDINKTGQINIYGAWTDASNYERLSFSAPSAANAVIGTNKAGTGTARGLEFQTDGVTRMTFSADGVLASIWPTNLNTGSQIRVAGQTRITNSSDGVLKITDSSEGSFNRLQLGGSTDASPAIARDGAGIKFTGAAAGSTSWIKVPPVAVSALPLAATAGAGARAFVNDASSPTFGSAVTGGGAVLVPVYSTGSAWNVG